MHICMLSELFYPYMLGGAERRYYEIAVRLAKKHEVTVYSLGVSGRERVENVGGVEIRRVGVPHPTDRRRLPPLATFFPALLKAMKNEYDVLDSNQGMASFLGFLKPLTKRPFVATFHDLYWNQWGEHFAFPFSGIGKSMEFLWSKAKYDVILANSPKTREKLERLGFGRRIETIASGLDLDFMDSVKAARQEKTILYVGRLEKYKSVDSLIRAVHEVSRSVHGLRLIIIGAGSEERRLKDLAKVLGVKADFLGFVDEKEKVRLMKSATVLVNPSQVEGLGLVVLEAMACGTPVVVRDLDCYFFCGQKNSVKFRDENGLVAGLAALLHSGRERKRLSKNGAKTSRTFSWDETAKKVEAVYKTLV